MTSTEIANASKIMIGSTEAIKMYIGSTLIWEALTTLPYDAEIEYLEGTGTQWIDTLIHPETGYGFELYGGFTTFNNNEFFGGGNNYNNGLGICTHGTVTYGIIVGTNEVCTISAQNNVMHLFRVNTDGTVYIDNEYKGQSTSPQMPSGNYTMNIFRHSATAVPRQAKIYYCKIFNSNGLVFDGIPVRKNSVGYMYDRVSGLLYGNDGTGSFTLGPDKPLPSGYTELEYISSTSGGNQYIDLGIKLYETLNTNYDIAMKFNIASGNANQAAVFACQDSDNDPWPGTFVRVNSSSGKVIGRYIGGTAKDNTLGNIGADIELPVQTSPNKNVTSLNNNNSTHQYGTSLFCAFVGGINTPARYCNAKLYYFKLFVGGTLVRDLIPCKNSNNVVGMYDVVNNVFYTSPNGNAFVAGPAV